MTIANTQTLCPNTDKTSWNITVSGDNAQFPPIPENMNFIDLIGGEPTCKSPATHSVVNLTPTSGIQICNNGECDPRGLLVCLYTKGHGTSWTEGFLDETVLQRYLCARENTDCFDTIIGWIVNGEYIAGDTLNCSDIPLPEDKDAIVIPFYGSFTVNFDGNTPNPNVEPGQVSGTRSSVTCSVNQQCNLTNTNTGFTKTGYLLSSWNTLADGSGVDISATTQNTNALLATTPGIASGFTSVSGGIEVTLKAKWINNQIDVVYRCGDGSGSPTTTQTQYQQTFHMATGAGNCTYSGHNFTGWACSYDDNNTPHTVLADGATYNQMVTSTCIAQWELASITCPAGRYLPAGATDCSVNNPSSLCQPDYYCEGGTFQYNANSDQGAKLCHDYVGVYTYSEAGSDAQEDCYMGVYTAKYSTLEELLEAVGDDGNIDIDDFAIKYENIKYGVPGTYHGVNTDYVLSHDNVNDIDTFRLTTLPTRTAPTGYSFWKYYIWAPLSGFGMISLEDTSDIYAQGFSLEDLNGVFTVTTSTDIPEELSDYVLIPLWEPNTYTVSYNCADGVAAHNPADVTQYFGAAFTKLNTQGNCSKTGYTFGGWSCAYLYTPTDLPGDGSRYTEDSDAVCTAIWTENDKYKVTYTCNGTEKHIANNIVYNVNVSASAYPDYVEQNNTNICATDGYTVGNSFTCVKAGTTDSVTLPALGSVWNIQSNVVCDATMTPVSFTVKFDGNAPVPNYTNIAVTGQKASVNCTYGSTCNLTNNPTNSGFQKRGHTFLGWQANVPDKDDYNSSLPTVDISAISNANINALWPYLTNGNNGLEVTLYAHWNDGDCVEINLNGQYYETTNQPDINGTGPNATPEYTKTVYVKYNDAVYSDNTCTTPFDPNDLVMPEYDGHEFISFNVNKAGGSLALIQYNAFTSYAKTAIFTQQNSAGVPTWWAKWEHIVKYSCGDGTGTLSVQTRSIGLNASTSSIQSVVGTNCTKPGYVFDSWNCTYDSDGTPVGSTYDQSTTATCVPIWTEGTYAVSLNDARVLNPNQPSYWIAADTNANPRKIYQKYTIGWYTDSAATTPFESLIAMPTQVGYTFTGFHTQVGGTGEEIIDEMGNLVDGASTNLFTVNNNTANLYAKWVPNIYELSLDLQGGTSGEESVPEAIYVKYDWGYYHNAIATQPLTSASQTAISVPSKVGYVFQGFYTQPNGSGTKVLKPDGTLVLGTSSTLFTSDATLYAYWTEGIYSIKIDSAYYESADIADDEGQSVGTNATPIYIYQKYNVGWYTNIACTTAFESLTRLPQYQGYTFGGFWTGKTGTGIQIIDAEGNLVANAGTTEFTASYQRLYAKWTIENYNINYDNNGGTCDGDNSPNCGPLTYNVTDNIVLENPNKDGYDFIGWCRQNSQPNNGNQCDIDCQNNTDMNCRVKPNPATLVAIATGSTGDRWFYSQYDASSYNIDYYCDYYDDIEEQLELGTSDYHTIQTFNQTFNTASLATTGCSKSGYTFTGWTCTYLDVSNRPYALGGTVLNDNTTYNTAVSAACIATWEANVINLNWNNNNGETVYSGATQCTYDSVISPVQQTHRPGYTFNGWEITSVTPPTP